MLPATKRARYMSSRVTVKTKKIAIPSKVEVRVGILEPGASHDGGMTVGELAEIHEFGGGNVPARAPIRSSIDNANGADVKLASTLFDQAEQSERGLPAFEQAAGLFAVKQAAAIRNNLPNLEPIADSTAKRKEAKGYPPPHTPLIETGVLKNSYVGDAKVTP
jgi:hypothetical protein